jgi:hypothetical protein
VNGAERRYCTNCGAGLRPEDRFCGACGTAAGHSRNVTRPPEVISILSRPEFATAGRDAGFGAVLALMVAGVLVLLTYLVLGLGGLLEGLAGSGIVAFVLLHGGAALVEVPPVPVLGIGGSARIDLPGSSLAVLPFAGALLAGRMLGQRVGSGALFVLAAAGAYSLVVAGLAFFGAAVIEADGVRVELAAAPFSNAVWAFFWVFLGAGIGAYAARRDLLPSERLRRVIRGALCAVGASLLLTVALAVVFLLARSGSGEGVQREIGVPAGDSPDPNLGVFFLALPTILGMLWLMAHGPPVGFHGLPDLGGVPFIGAELAELPLRMSLLGAWEGGWEWRLLLLAPVVGLTFGGLVAARGAASEERWWIGALVAVPYAVVAAGVALFTRVSADLSLAGATVGGSFGVGLPWLLLLLPAGAVFGALGGLFAGCGAAGTPQPQRAFLIAAAASGVLLLGSVPGVISVAASGGSGAGPAPGLAYPPEPTIEQPAGPEQPFEDPAPPGVEPSPDPEGSYHPAFAPLIPTLEQMTAAPIMLPAELPSELAHPSVDADTSEEGYGILFLAEPGDTVESYVRARTLAMLRALPGSEAREPDYFEVTSEETVELSEGTEATLRYLEPDPPGGNAVPYWEGRFSRDGYTYLLETPLADLSRDELRRMLASMSEVSRSPEARAAAEQRFVTEYYGAVAAGDWSATYDLLDTPSRMHFSEAEWIEAQEARIAATNPPPLESAELVDLSGEGAGFLGTVTLYYTDGTRETIEVPVVFEDGEFRRQLTEDDVSYLRSLLAEGSSDEDLLRERDEVEAAIRSHYAAIGRQDFSTAYSYFGPTYRSEVGEADWISEEESFDIRGSQVNSVEVTSVTGDTATATVDVEFVDNTGTPRFVLDWRLVLEGGEWKLDEVLDATRL